MRANRREQKRIGIRRRRILINYNQVNCFELSLAANEINNRIRKSATDCAQTRRDYELSFANRLKISSCESKNQIEYKEEEGEEGEEGGYFNLSLDIFALQ